MLNIEDYKIGDTWELTRRHKTDYVTFTKGQRVEIINVSYLPGEKRILVQVEDEDGNRLLLTSADDGNLPLTNRIKHKPKKPPKTVVLEVKMTVEHSVGMRELHRYVRDALDTWGGQFHPKDHLSYMAVRKNTKVRTLTQTRTGK